MLDVLSFPTQPVGATSEPRPQQSGEDTRRRDRAHLPRSPASMRRRRRRRSLRRHRRSGALLGGVAARRCAYRPCFCSPRRASTRASAPRCRRARGSLCVNVARACVVATHVRRKLGSGQLAKCMHVSSFQTCVRYVVRSFARAHVHLTHASSRRPRPHPCPSRPYSLTRVKRSQHATAHA
jgi:hypothetical protein